MTAVQLGKQSLPHLLSSFHLLGPLKATNGEEAQVSLLEDGCPCFGLEGPPGGPVVKNLPCNVGDSGSVLSGN